VADRLRLVTERLVLTPFDPAVDWPSFVSDLVLDPEVTRSWADFADPSLTDAEKERRARDEFVPWFDEGRARGLVAWTVRTLDGRFLGVCGLLVAGPPVGAMLGSRWHGQGYATEAGRAILDDGWERLGLARIITVLDSPNPAPRRLVDKLGFRFDRVELDGAGRPHVCFVIDRPPASST
jgi:RimJ/RimL family protein N-acetyltransferase